MRAVIGMALVLMFAACTDVDPGSPGANGQENGQEAPSVSQEAAELSVTLAGGPGAFCGVGQPPCNAGLFCVSNAGALNGFCRAPGGAGALCGVGQAPCASGLFCVSNAGALNGFCRAPGGVGAFCGVGQAPCASGLFCDAPAGSLNGFCRR